MQAIMEGSDDSKPTFTIYHEGRVYHKIGDYYTLLRDRHTTYSTPVSIMHPRYHRLRARIDKAVYEIEAII